MAEYIDRVEIKKGWIWHEDSLEYECYNCRCRFDCDKILELLDLGLRVADCCPNCGAKMG